MQQGSSLAKQIPLHVIGTDLVPGSVSHCYGTCCTGPCPSAAMASRGSDPSKWAIACWGCVLDALQDFEKIAKSTQPAAAKAEALEECLDPLNGFTGEVVNTEGIPLSTWEHVVNKMKVRLAYTQQENRS